MSAPPRFDEPSVANGDVGTLEGDANEGGVGNDGGVGSAGGAETSGAVTCGVKVDTDVSGPSKAAGNGAAVPVEIPPELVAGGTKAVFVGAGVLMLLVIDAGVDAVDGAGGAKTGAGGNGAVNASDVLGGSAETGGVDERTGGATGGRGATRLDVASCRGAGGNPTEGAGGGVRLTGA